ncbi:glutathione transferase GstA [Desulfocastanea catecholica]
MKLYYAVGACSLAPHIILRETGLPFQLERVDLARHQLANGQDYFQISKRGQVPLLELDDGSKIAEGPVISQYIAEQAERKDLLPPSGALERYRVLEWLNFISSELHKSYSLLFNKEQPEEAKAITLRALRKKYEWVAEQLSGKDYLMGDNFTVADAYLFAVTNWAENFALDLSDLEPIEAFQKRVKSRPAVLESLKAEGLDS